MRAKLETKGMKNRLLKSKSFDLKLKNLKLSYGVLKISVTQIEGLKFCVLYLYISYNMIYKMKPSGIYHFILLIYIC